MKNVPLTVVVRMQPLETAKINLWCVSLVLSNGIGPRTIQSPSNGKSVNPRSSNPQQPLGEPQVSTEPWLRMTAVGAKGTTCPSFFQDESCLTRVEFILVHQYCFSERCWCKRRLLFASTPPFHRHKHACSVDESKQIYTKSFLRKIFLLPNNYKVI